MDMDWTFSSCSWLWEEDIEFKNGCVHSHWSKEDDKAFENALALYHNDADRWKKIASAVPEKTIEDVKLHYEALNEDVLAIECGKVPLPHCSSTESDHRKKKKTVRGVNRGTPWTEEEHRRFLDGLEKYGKGDWKSIARFSVQTKSNSQVASHAQKYFKRLNSTSKDGKRQNINDITSDHPKPASKLHKPPTNTMTINNDKASENAGKQLWNRAPSSDMSTPPFYGHTCQESDSIFYPSSPLMQGIRPSPPPTLFDIPSISKIERLMQANGASTHGMFGVPVKSEMQSSIQDRVVPTSDLFAFPSINEFQLVKGNEVHSCSFDTFHVSNVQPLTCDCCSLDVPFTCDI
ncbi:hypothetical protein OROMI_032022 [Orobanche minor]